MQYVGRIFALVNVTRAIHCGPDTSAGIKNVYEAVRPYYTGCVRKKSSLFFMNYVLSLNNGENTEALMVFRENRITLNELNLKATDRQQCLVVYLI